MDTDQLTHSTKHTSNLKYKIKFQTSRDFRRSLNSLQRLCSQLRKQQRETRIIIMRLSNFFNNNIISCCNIRQRSLIKKGRSSKNTAQQIKSTTYQENPDSKIPTMQQPERPRSQPPITSLECNRQHSIFENTL